MSIYRIRDGLAVRLFRLRHAGKFKVLGPKARVLRPAEIIGPDYISIGSGVAIGALTTLAAVKIGDGQEPDLTIEEETHLGNFNHIYCTGKIHIGPRVLTANGVYISDNQHSYTDTATPILAQPILQLGTVSIGEGAWLGHNSCVLGVSVGRNSIVGANSVVTKDVPDYSLAVGAPAKVVKRFDWAGKTWRKTTPTGDFLE